VVRFKWIEWNELKIAAHGLKPEEVEHAYRHRIGRHEERSDGSFESVGRTPSGRTILMVWRYDEEFDSLEKDHVVEVVFIVTAY
jgi:hypothetical protein